MGINTRLQQIAADMMSVSPHGQDVADGWPHPKNFLERRLPIASVTKTIEVTEADRRRTTVLTIYPPLCWIRVGTVTLRGARMWAKGACGSEYTETGGIEVLMYIVQNCGVAIGSEERSGNQ
ncbi:MAG TPA: hypothetical protein GXX40_08025 [Firmicutes bacterium]|nr:hypothetical protein [Bacillota bacterium]